MIESFLPPTLASNMINIIGTEMNLANKLNRVDCIKDNGNDHENPATLG